MKNREIKFRAWHKYARKMACIDMLDFTLDAYMARAGKLSGSGHLADIELMQFTGIVDKHGKEVYEGDIVKYDDINTHGVVTWMSNSPGFVIINPEKSGVFVLHSEWEVIGNIYEHPHLIQEREA